VVAGTTFALSALLNKFIFSGLMSGIGYLTGFSTGVSVGVALLSGWTLLPIAVGACIVGYSTYKGKSEVLPALSYLDPNMGFIGAMLVFLSSGSACDVLGFLFGKRTARWCNSKLTPYAKKMNHESLLTVLDFLLLLVRLFYDRNFDFFGFFGETRCEKLLSGLLDKDRISAQNQATEAIEATRKATEAAGKAFEIGAQISKNKMKVEQLSNSRQSRQSHQEIARLKQETKILEKSQQETLNTLDDITKSVDFKTRIFEMIATFDQGNQTIGSISKQLITVNKMLAVAKLEQETATSPLTQTSTIEDLTKAQLSLKNDLNNFAFIKQVQGTESDLKELQTAQKLLAEAEISAEKPATSSFNPLALQVYKKPISNELNTIVLVNLPQNVAEIGIHPQEMSATFTNSTIPTASEITTSIAGKTTTPIANATAIEPTTPIAAPMPEPRAQSLRPQSQVPSPGPPMASPENPLYTITDKNGLTMAQNQKKWFRSVQYLEVDDHNIKIEPNWKHSPDITYKIFREAMKDNKKAAANQNKHFPDTSRDIFLYFDTTTCQDFDCTEPN